MVARGPVSPCGRRESLQSVVGRSAPAAGGRAFSPWWAGQPRRPEGEPSVRGGPVSPGGRRESLQSVVGRSAPAAAVSVPAASRGQQ